MRRSQRLRNIVQLSSGELGEIERRMAQLSREIAAYERQGLDLQAARNEYAGRIQVQGGSTVMSGGEVRTLLAFLQRVDEAIAQVGEQLEVRRQSHAEYQQRWLTAKQKSKVMHDIVDRLAQAELNSERQREQRESDDRPRRVRD